MDADTPKEQRAEFKDQTRDCFIALSYFKRSGVPDRKHHISFWMEEAEIVLRSLGKSTSIKLGPFAMAMLMHGDIAFEGLAESSGRVVECPPGMSGSGYVHVPFSVGLNKYEGAEAKDAWKTVLANGRPLAQLPGPTPPSQNYQSLRPVVTLLPELDWEAGQRI